jgi:hypothetical protein
MKKSVGSTFPFRDGNQTLQRPLPKIPTMPLVLQFVLTMSDESKICLRPLQKKFFDGDRRIQATKVPPVLGVISSAT